MKKGFTLVEVLGVLVILGVIMLLLVPNITNVTKKSKQQLYEMQIKTIKEAGRIFVTDYANILPIENGDSFTIELKLLKDLDIINQNMQNPKTEKYFDDDMLITFTNNNDNYEIEVYPNDRDTYEKEIEYKKHFILLKGNETSDNTSLMLEENFIVMNNDGKIYDDSEYEVSIINVNTFDSTYSEVTYKIVVTEDSTISYTIKRKENCQTGICE